MLSSWFIVLNTVIFVHFFGRYFVISGHSVLMQAVFPLDVEPAIFRASVRFNTDVG